MSNDSKARFNDPDLWIRMLYMILFAILTGLARLVLCAIAILQFLAVLFSGSDSRSLRHFAAGLAEWTLRSFRFLCFNTEQKPFPFEDWPESQDAEEAAATDTDAADSDEDDTARESSDPSGQPGDPADNGEGPPRP